MIKLKLLKLYEKRIRISRVLQDESEVSGLS